MTRRQSLVEAILGLAGLAMLAAIFGAIAFGIGLLIAGARGRGGCGDEQTCISL